MMKLIKGTLEVKYRKCLEGEGKFLLCYGTAEVFMDVETEATIYDDENNIWYYGYFNYLPTISGVGRWNKGIGHGRLGEITEESIIKSVDYTNKLLKKLEEEE